MSTAMQQNFLMGHLEAPSGTEEVLPVERGEDRTLDA
jgi:hypothetical protein